MLAPLDRVCGWGVRVGVISCTSRGMFGLITPLWTGHCPFSHLCGSLSWGRESEGFASSLLAWCCLLGTSFSRSFWKMGLSTGIPRESSNCALVGSQWLRVSLPGWPQLGSRCWPNAGSCRSQVAGSSRQNCREIIRCCITFRGWWHPCFENCWKLCDRRGRVESCNLFSFIHAKSSMGICTCACVCAHLQGGAIYSSCTPSPVRLLLNRLPWPSEAIWRHWVGGAKGNQILRWGKSRRRSAQTEETLQEIMLL